jgi:hypothetical protein
MPQLRIPPLLIAASLCLSACGTPTPSLDPVNTVIQVPGLPPLSNGNVKDIRRTYTWRMIMPVTEVNPFSLMQQHGRTLQVTLQPSQIAEIEIAKEKIRNTEFLQPEMATILAFRVGGRYPDAAAQIIREIIGEYIKKRDSQIDALREMAVRSAQYEIAMNKARAAGIAKQATDHVDTFKRPTTAIVDRANDPKLQTYIAYAQWRQKINAQQAAESRKQAEYMKKLREENPQAGYQFGAYSLNETPYRLSYLGNGDFMLEATGDVPLPPVIRLDIDGFSAPVTIPVLEMTARDGHPIFSVQRDTQGMPLVRGGFSGDQGQIDLTKSVFTLRYQGNEHQLDLLRPDGQQSTYALNQFEALPELQVAPTVSAQLPQISLQQARQPFADIYYEFTPDLDQLPPELLQDLVTEIEKTPF